MTFAIIEIELGSPIVYEEIEETCYRFVAIRESNLPARPILVMNDRYPMAVVVLGQCDQRIDILAHHSQVNIIVPRNKSPMTNGAEQGPECKPVS